MKIITFILIAWQDGLEVERTIVLFVERKSNLRILKITDSENVKKWFN